MHAEDIYLFRHSVLRDAAYELQFPTVRAELHALAYALIEAALGGRTPKPPELSADDYAEAAPHRADPYAYELAEHARRSQPEENSRSEYTSVRRHYLRRAAEYFARTFQRVQAGVAWSELGDMLNGKERGVAYSQAAHEFQSVGRISTAEELYGRAIAAHQEKGNSRGVASVLERLAGLYKDTGRMKEAVEYYQIALTKNREVGDQRGESATLGGLANYYRHIGRLDLAEDAIENALATIRQLKNRRDEGILLGNYALLLQTTGRLDRAEETHERALKIHRDCANKRSQGIVLGNLGLLYQETDRDDLAEQTYNEALIIHREVGFRRGEAIAIANLANIYLHSDRKLLAQDAYDRALAIHQETGNRRGEGVVLGNMAHLHQYLGNPENVEVLYMKALKINREVANRRFEGLVQCDFGIFRLGARQYEEAEKLWCTGAKILSSLGDVSGLRRKTTAMLEGCAKANIQPFKVPKTKESTPVVTENPIQP
ncbi:tetratricopeptide repeat protein [Planctomycetota bacterium]|nr:tetratricopeptide repeat protein [Planctomycetota bacterium]